MPNLAIQHLLLNMLQYWDFSKENISERETVLAGGSRREREREIHFVFYQTTLRKKLASWVARWTASRNSCNLWFSKMEMEIQSKINIGLFINCLPPLISKSHCLNNSSIQRFVFSGGWRKVVLEPSTIDKRYTVSHLVHLSLKN